MKVLLVAQLLILLVQGQPDCEDQTRICPVSFPIRSDIGLAENCEGAGATSIRNSVRSDVTGLINNEIKGRLNRILNAKYLGQAQRYPASSCREILESFPDSESGFYWLNNTNGVVFQAYCNMELTCGPNITGWMRVVDLDVTDIHQTCPMGNFRLVTGPNRHCVRAINNPGCDGTTFTARQVSYTQICGRATAYQIGDVGAFHAQNPTDTIDESYVDGISLTYGSPRNHIWTFVAARSEMQTACPCSTGSTNNSPSYVGDNYFCESAATSTTVGNTVFPRDDLWDGELCRSLETPCCEGNFNPPWFYRDLENSQSLDIEMRLCVNEGGDEDVGLQNIELYVQ